MAQYARGGMMRSADLLVRTHAHCFVLLFTIVHLIESSHRQEVDPVSLQSAVDDYLRLHKELYGVESMIIKFHWLHHFSTFLQRWGPLPSCWVLERKHRLPKKFANNVRNTQANYDASVLREVTCHHLGVFRAQPARTFLPGRLSKTKARINIYEIVCVGDVVIFARGGGELGAGSVADFPSELTCTICTWTMLEKEACVSRWATHSPTRLAVALDAVKAACVYAGGGGGGVATVLHPSLF